jgi:hypothetical protein
MRKAKQTLTQAFLERISRGAVPMGGFYWVDPKDLRARGEHAKAAVNVNAAGNANAAETDSKGREVTAPKADTHVLYAAPAGERL